MCTKGLKKWALLLTFWVALELSPLHGQTITGNTVSGDFTVTGNSDLQGDTLTLGTRTDNSDPGELTLYTDGTTSTLEFDASRGANIWKWQQNGYTTPLQVQMSLNLSNDNELVLYNQASTPVAKITLNPLGTSTFVNSVTIDGTDNEMPSQTLVNSHSVLTEGLADSRYLSNSDMTTGSGTYNGTTGPNLGLNRGTASGAYSFAEGNGSTASGPYSTAMGRGSIASALVSTAFGNYSTASGNGSTAMGGSTASGIGSTALGTSTASGFGSTSTGWYTTASGYYSTAMGRGSIASGLVSTASGNYSTASGNGSTALGGSTASGIGSTALGTSIASGFGSTSTGWYTTASGYYSTAMGDGSTASGNYAIAMGMATTAQAFGSVAIGEANIGLSSTGATPSATTWVATDPLFEIGNGTASTYSSYPIYAWSSPVPSDAFVVYKNGNAAVQGTVTTGGGITAGGVITAQPGGDIPMYTGE